MREVTIMRGIPGSGKSYMAKKIAGDNGVIVSADDFFVENDEYKFVPEMIGDAHISCMRNFLDCITDEIENIIVDNTNIQTWEYSPYILVAQASGYDIEIVEVVAPFELCAKRQTHNVPVEVLRRMKERYQFVLPQHVFMVRTIENYDKE